MAGSVRRIALLSGACLLLALVGGVMGEAPAVTLPHNLLSSNTPAASAPVSAGQTQPTVAAAASIPTPHFATYAELMQQKQQQTLDQSEAVSEDLEASLADHDHHESTGLSLAPNTKPSSGTVAKPAPSSPPEHHEGPCDSACMAVRSVQNIKPSPADKAKFARYKKALIEAAHAQAAKARARRKAKGKRKLSKKKKSKKKKGKKKKSLKKKKGKKKKSKKKKSLKKKGKKKKSKKKKSLKKKGKKKKSKKKKSLKKKGKKKKSKKKKSLKKKGKKKKSKKKKSLKKKGKKKKSLKKKGKKKKSLKKKGKKKKSLKKKGSKKGGEGKEEAEGKKEGEGREKKLQASEEQSASPAADSTGAILKLLGEHGEHFYGDSTETENAGASPTMLKLLRGSLDDEDASEW